MSEFYKVLNENKAINKNSIDYMITPAELEKLTSLVFDADPLTGNPRSDVAYMLKGSDPAFKQYIKDNLMSANSSASAALADSADEAMELVHKNVMTESQYSEMVIDFVKKQYQNDSD